VFSAQPCITGRWAGKGKKSSNVRGQGAEKGHQDTVVSPPKGEGTTGRVLDDRGKKNTEKTFMVLKRAKKRRKTYPSVVPGGPNKEKVGWDLHTQHRKIRDGAFRENEKNDRAGGDPARNPCPQATKKS